MKFELLGKSEPCMRTRGQATGPVLLPRPALPATLRLVEEKWSMGQPPKRALRPAPGIPAAAPLHIASQQKPCRLRYAGKDEHLSSVLNPIKFGSTPPAKQTRTSQAQHGTAHRIAQHSGPAHLALPPWLRPSPPPLHWPSQRPAAPARGRAAAAPAARSSPAEQQGQSTAVQVGQGGA